MTASRLEGLLRELGRRQAEPAPQGLCERIKHHIPARHLAGGWGKGTINIMVHLKISRVAAVAAIVLSLIVFGGFFGSKGWSDTEWTQDIKTAVRDALGGNGSSAGLARVYEDLASSGVEAVYFERNANSQDPTLILMYWRLPEGDYRVVFSNGRVVRASPEMLIGMQAQMIKDSH
jgi:hypothetical protein